MRLSTYRADDGWHWLLEGDDGPWARSERGYRTRRGALGQWQHLHERLKEIDRLDAPPALPGEGQKPVGR